MNGMIGNMVMILMEGHPGALHGAMVNLLHPHQGEDRAMDLEVRKNTQLSLP